MSHFFQEDRKKEQRKRAISLGVTSAEFDFIASSSAAPSRQVNDIREFTDQFLDRLAATNNQQERDKILLDTGGNDPAFRQRAAAKVARSEVVKLGRRRGFTSTIRGGAGAGRNTFLQPLGGPVSPESRQFLGG